MDRHVEKTASGWTRFLDRIRKLWETPPPPKSALQPPIAYAVLLKDDAPAAPGVSSR